MRVLTAFLLLGCSSTAFGEERPGPVPDAAEAAAAAGATADGAAGSAGAGGAAAEGGAAGSAAGAAGAEVDAGGEAPVACNPMLCPSVQSTYPKCCTEDGYCGHDFGQGYCMPIIPKDIDAGGAWLCSDSEPAGGACVCMRGTGTGKPMCDVTPQCCAYQPGLTKDYNQLDVQDWCGCLALIGSECDAYHLGRVAVAQCPPN